MNEDCMTELTKDDLIAAAKKAATEIEGPLSFRDFLRLSGISEYHIARHFPEGRWTELRELAGLPRHGKDKEPITGEELLSQIHRVISELGRIPTKAVLVSRLNISSTTIAKRLGIIEEVFQKYQAWLEKHHPDSHLIDLIKEKSRQEIAIPAPDSKKQSAAAQWAKGAGLFYGAPINFRGLRHAPINEQGVVYLFGMVSAELGLIVEAVQSAYPDCEAKRCVDSKGNRWQRVRIEFEFRSGNFKDHGHDPAACDMIVCWEHDWQECPLEVVELRSVIEELEG
jgi:hypothetical protein